ncbi:MAG: hypothetical protein IJI06_08660 [Oscillospiraceae bacterium]|nr:hypothetical protein [Oscillospiraceae bacterium]
MNAREIITEVNDLSPNQYDNDLKLKWLEDLDGKIFRELIERHDDPETEERFTEADYEDTGVELLIGPPYARDIYVNFLRGKIAEANAETERYNLYAAAFNANYQEYAALYNSRTPMKRQRGWRY